MAAAWHLSNLEDCEVHVFERSWRLGGKGASSRDENGRILEHGLHVWLGFYENAFRMMRDCYAEVEEAKWGPDAAKGARLAHRSFEDAFVAEPSIGVGHKASSGHWEVWRAMLPPAPGRPGEPFDAECNPFTLAGYLARTLDLLKALMLSVIEPMPLAQAGAPRPDARSSFDEALQQELTFDPKRAPGVLIERMARMLKGATLVGAAGLLQGVTLFETWLRTLDHSPQYADTVLQFVEAITAQARKLLRDVVSVDPETRLKTEIIDIVITIVVGLYRDRVMFDERGLDALDDIDYRTWLRDHGATRTSLESPFLRGIYELVFAYDEGDRNRPALSAGVALRGALRMFFTYRGSMFWRMRSGMGDVVFAPLYRVLTQRRNNRVHMHLLHELSKVNFEKNQRGRLRVSSLEFKLPDHERSRLRAAGKLAAATWEALDQGSAQALDHFGCWPDDSDGLRKASLLKGKGVQSACAQPRTVTFNAGGDLADGFDFVIFALGIDDLKKPLGLDGGSDLGAQTTWAEMAKEVRTVATASAQVWFHKDFDAFGWRGGPGITSSLPEPYQTWADMTHTIPSETKWRVARAQDSRQKRHVGEPARSVAYFCAVLDDKRLARGESFLLKEQEYGVQRMLAGDVGVLRDLWPGAFSAKGGTAGDAVLHAGTYVRVNTAGSERYTLSRPGSSRYRISPLDDTVVNMSIAGDWTACGLDAGCVEAAVMSGMLAAHAVSGGVPALEDIIGYDHP